MSRDIFDREALRQQPHYGGTSKPGSNGSGLYRSQNPPQPPVSPVLLAGSVGSIIVLSIILVVSLLFSGGSPQAAPDAVQAPTVHATTAPTPMSTPTPSCNPATNYLDMISLLERRKQWGAVPDIVTEALAMKQLCAHARTVLHERALTAKLHVLLAQPLSVLQVAEQQQVVNHYRKLEQQAMDAGALFPTPLAGAKLAADAKKFLLTKTLLEEEYVAGEYTKADQELVRLYREVLFRLGWNYAEHGSDAQKAEGVRLLAASYALEKEQGITQGDAWAELVKHCGPKEKDWPPPAETPLLPTTQKGGS